MTDQPDLLGWMHPVARYCEDARWSVRLAIWIFEKRGNRLTRDRLKAALRDLFGSDDIGEQLAYHGYCHSWDRRFGAEAQ